IGEWIQPTVEARERVSTNGNGKHVAQAPEVRGLLSDPVAGSAKPTLEIAATESAKQPDRYGIVVFSHLRWGFVWQRPQQFLSRFAKKHPVLFIEEPFFDVAEGGSSRLDLHRVMPNVTVATPHCPPSWAKNPGLPRHLREW